MRKALAALAALLTACSNARVEPMSAARQTEAAGRGDSIVLMRFAGQGADKPFNPLADIDSSVGPRVVFQNLDTEATFRSPADLHFPAPSAELADSGWVYFELPAGSYYLGLNTSATDLRAPGQGLRFVVPTQSSIVYIGTFRISCAGDKALRACEAQARIEDESSEATEIAARNFSTVGGFIPELATAYGSQPDGERLAASVAPDISFSRAAWHLSREQDEPPPPKPHPLSSSPGSGWSGGNAFSGCGGPGCGELVLAVLIVAGVIIAVDQIDKALAGPKQQPCTTALRGSIAVDRLKPLLTGFAFDADAQQTPTGGSLRWEASVSRVLLRKCATGDSFAVEVAARWRAVEARTGRTPFDAVLVSAPSSPWSDRRVAHPWDRNSPLPPWELAIPEPSACRPLADYCAADGAGLVAQDVAGALQGMRAWLIDPTVRSSSLSVSLGRAQASPWR
ncbi:MAG TPA: hypothetical protein VMU06_20870 [Stellaceae bacterium]|nr:hypothetical protein [Stellaceae bacterium]